MPITDTAQATHTMLFGSHTSPLARTDPEFVEAFDNFAFDEVTSRSNLPVELRLKVTTWLEAVTEEQYASAHATLWVRG